MPDTTTDQPIELRERDDFVGPDAPIRLFIWRYRCPISGVWQTLDTGARTRDVAFSRAVRFLRAEHRRYAKAGVKAKQNIRIPRAPEALTLVMPTEAR